MVTMDSPHKEPVRRGFDIPVVEQVAEQVVDQLVIWNYMTLMWRHCNDISQAYGSSRLCAVLLITGLTCQLLLQLKVSILPDLPPLCTHSSPPLLTTTPTPFQSRTLPSIHLPYQWSHAVSADISHVHVRTGCCGRLSQARARAASAEYWSAHRS